MVKRNIKANIMLTFDSHGQEINRHHLLAQQKATDAVEHAHLAGKLLLEVKKGMKHGKFQSWVNDNAQVSMRQAQRYMAVAQGKPVAMRQLAKKNDTVVSHLKNPDDQGSVIDGNWIPTLGYCYVHCADQATFWVVPDEAQPQYVHISKLYQTERDPNVPSERFTDPDDPYDEREWDGMSRIDCTKNPVGLNYAHKSLTLFGVENLSKVKWESWKTPGSPTPFGTPNFVFPDEIKI